jgi:TIR domain
VATNEIAFAVPAKLPAYLRRLCISYKSENAKFSDLLMSANTLVREGAEYDNYNGGTFGHHVVVFLHPSFFESHTIKDQERLVKRLTDDLRTIVSGFSNEFISGVSFELIDESDPEYQRSRPINASVDSNYEVLQFWHKNFVRLFISHRDNHKKEAHELRDALEQYGISSFVAHDTIEPMSTWQVEIVKALQTMEVMLCFVTDDFDSSVWTNQEVGFALGRRTPIVSLKLQSKSPPGFIASEQALRGSIAEVSKSAAKVAELIAKKVGHGERIESAILEAFSQSRSFAETEITFDRMVSFVTKLTNAEADSVVKSYNDNTQINSAFYLSKSNRITNYLARATGKSYQIKAGQLVRLRPVDIDDIPF